MTSTKDIALASIISLVLALIIVFILMAAAGSPETTENVPTMEVYEITLSNGVPCAVIQYDKQTVGNGMPGRYISGMSCDWNQLTRE